eukprot:g23340.t1
MLLRCGGAQGVPRCCSFGVVLPRWSGHRRFAAEFHEEEPRIFPGARRSQTRQGLELPEGWRQFQSPSRGVYYGHTSGATRFDFPTGPPSKDERPGRPRATRRVLKAVPGVDSTGRCYADMKSFWRAKRATWYQRVQDYWAGAEANDDGAPLGRSATFDQALKKTLTPPVTFGTVLDCGAGVGRVAQSLLLPRFGAVDLLEPCRPLRAAARQRLRADASRTRFLAKALQDFTPTKDT